MYKSVKFPRHLSGDKFAGIYYPRFPVVVFDFLFVFLGILNYSVCVKYTAIVPFYLSPTVLVPRSILTEELSS